MSTTTKSKRPTHTAYVIEGEGDKASWTEVGALWPHEDSKGYNVTLRALPTNGRLVIRQRKAEEGAGE